jgi:hypothetical protein
MSEQCGHELHLDSGRYFVCTENHAHSGDHFMRKGSYIVARWASTPSAPRESLDGASLIAAERQRQTEVEGWTPEHDNEHRYGEMAKAALCYADYAATQANHPMLINPEGTHEAWPWADEWWKPSPDPIRNLVKAGALIAAEIDRLTRAK